jgi:hypothetical protein
MLLNGYFRQKQEERRVQIQRALLHHEAEIGGRLFGTIPEGHRREFFCLDEHTWVWHEEWQDQSGQWLTMTTRYDVRPTGILKSQGGAAYQRLGREELSNFYRATKLYWQEVGEEYARMLEKAPQHHKHHLALAV